MDTVRNFKLPDVYGGGTLALSNLDDPSRYLSSEFAAIGVDELSKNEMSTFEFLRLRCRWPGVEHPKFVGATNPCGRTRVAVPSGELSSITRTCRSWVGILMACSKIRGIMSETFSASLYVGRQTHAI
jgi:hypothetical protein